ncbi:hypothetical protein AGLY_005638 [Aphis glycines]|uniref:Uncharacterized protein n=1 Tax=Aphis glycines TaxID=307491 RepID=A0A6G0TTB7_APHGL|nr:hypothetical protein AGLY_005638 [Aphis glycines]
MSRRCNTLNIRVRLNTTVFIFHGKKYSTNRLNNKTYNNNRNMIERHTSRARALHANRKLSQVAAKQEYDLKNTVRHTWRRWNYWPAGSAKYYYNTAVDLFFFHKVTTQKYISNRVLQKNICLLNSDIIVTQLCQVLKLVIVVNGKITVSGKIKRGFQAYTHCSTTRPRLTARHSRYDSRGVSDTHTQRLLSLSH